jgi:hypothetical protein
MVMCRCLFSKTQDTAGNMEETLEMKQAEPHYQGFQLCIPELYTSLTSKTQYWHLPPP